MSETKLKKRNVVKTEHFLKCDFCGKNHAAVKWLIWGPIAYICDDCVAVCVTIIAEKDAEVAKQAETSEAQP